MTLGWLLVWIPMFWSLSLPEVTWEHGLDAVRMVSLVSTTQVYTLSDMHLQVAHLTVGLRHFPTDSLQLPSECRNLSDVLSSCIYHAWWLGFFLYSYLWEWLWIMVGASFILFWRHLFHPFLSCKNETGEQEDSYFGKGWENSLGQNRPCS